MTTKNESVWGGIVIELDLIKLMKNTRRKVAVKIWRTNRKVFKNVNGLENSENENITNSWHADAYLFLGKKNLKKNCRFREYPKMQNAQIS